MCQVNGINQAIKFLISNMIIMKKIFSLKEKDKKSLFQRFKKGSKIYLTK